MMLKYIWKKQSHVFTLICYYENNISILNGSLWLSLIYFTAPDYIFFLLCFSCLKDYRSLNRCTAAFLS